MWNLAAVPILAVLAFISLPGWLSGIILGKAGALLVGVIVRPLMDFLKSAWTWLDQRPAAVKQGAVIVLGVLVALGLRALNYVVAGCDVSTPDGCNIFQWDAATWMGVLGALVAFVLKAGKQASAAAKTAREAVAVVRTVAPAPAAAAAAGAPSVVPPVSRTPFTSQR